MSRIGDSAPRPVRWHFHRWSAWTEAKKDGMPWAYQFRTCVVCRKTKRRDVIS